MNISYVLIRLRGGGGWAEQGGDVTVTVRS